MPRAKVGAGHAGVVVLAAVMAACGADAPPNESGSALREVLAATQERARLPAIAGVVVRREGALQTHVQGVRRLGDPEPVVAADLFHFGSNAKGATATMIATLVEQGRLEWSARPSEVFPELAPAFDRDAGNVTLEQLLAHRAGLLPLETLEELAELGLPEFEGTSAEQRLQFTAWVLGRPLASPASEYQYSNAGYGVAAAMAERITGESWEASMTSRLFQPLGMRATFGWPAQDAPDQPFGHLLTGRERVPHDPQNPAEQIPPYLLPAGGLSTSIEDYGRFLHVQLRGLRGEGLLLRPDTYRRLHAPVGGYLSIARDGYGLGWALQRLDGVATSFHTGGGGTFFAFAAIQAERGLAVAVVANAGDDEASAACEQAARELLARLEDR